MLERTGHTWVRDALVPAVGNIADRAQVRRGRVAQHAIHLAQLAGALVDQPSGSPNGAGSPPLTPG